MKLVVLHLVRYAGHVVHFGASGTRNVDALFLCSCGTATVSIQSAPGHVTQNMCFASGGNYGSRSALWCVWRMKRQRAIYLTRVGSEWIPHKVHQDTIR
jgi:hypothetical protein